VTTLRKEFEKEMEDSLERIEEAIAPYSRFVRAESERTEKIQAELSEAALEIDQLKMEIKGWGDAALDEN
jgi:septal ring factor EnvC (AmiA/AmiB activator)